MAEARASETSGTEHPGLWEWLGIFFLTVLAAYFLHQSWRKWADPIIDSGAQWYSTWRVSLGAIPVRDFAWNYGPLSLCFNGLLFKCFGPGMMVLAGANLAVFVAISALGYIAFRTAWGPLAAFVALGAFISVFSFSMVNSVGNYNYVLPYSNETTHGILVLFVTTFAAARWMRGKSLRTAFLFGLCGGIAAVLKPEFMLAGGVLGIVAIVMRCRANESIRLMELVLIAAGIVLPTLFFTVWFGLHEPLRPAFGHATRAWSVLIQQAAGGGPDESGYMGYDLAWRNIGFELEAGLSAILGIGAIWAAGWFLNRPWKPLVRWVLAAAAGYLACSIDMGGGFEIGPCFPALIIVALAIVFRDAFRQKRPRERELMALALVILAASMLVRMALRTRINHFGYYQAALAGMVIVAMLVAKVPRWAGIGGLGRRVTLAGILTMVAACCASVVAESNRNHVSQTQSIGDGRDRFFSFNPSMDDTGATVDWCARQMASTPKGSKLLVLPEGVMINYLSRRERPMVEYTTNMLEANYLQQLVHVSPDYIIIIWGDQRDAGIPRFGDPGFPGEKIVKWLRENYALINTHRERTRWSFVFRKS